MNSCKSQIITRDMRKYAGEILRSRNFQSSAHYIQHGNISVMKHSMRVAYASMWINRKLGINCVESDLTRGALLHDYFLYDWHDKDRPDFRPLHGFHHANKALENAMKEYTLSPREKDIIKKHMWPLTVVPPMCREAWVVTAADKVVSTIETLNLHERIFKGTVG